MLTRIDHVMICVPTLQQGIDAYPRIGFDMQPGGVHTGKGTHNALAFNQDDYLELLSVRDPAEHRAAVAGGGTDAGLGPPGPGRRIPLRHRAERRPARRRGRDAHARRRRERRRRGGRRTPAGKELRWKLAALGAKNPLPLFFIEHLTPLEERRRQLLRAGHHPNGVLRIERVYIAVTDVRAAAVYGRVLGLPVPPIQRGAVIKADMAVFDVGPTG